MAAAKNENELVFVVVQKPLEYGVVMFMQAHQNHIIIERPHEL